MNSIKLWVIYLLRVALLPFRIFPISFNKVVFISFNGKSYSCSPKYISEYLSANEKNCTRFESNINENRSKDNEYEKTDNTSSIKESTKTSESSKLEFVWILNDTNRYKHLEDKGYRLIHKNSLLYFYHILTAKVIVSNTNIASIFPPFRKSQVLINTWHGGGAYKRVSDDVDTDRVSMAKTRMTAAQTTWFISSNRRFSEVMSLATKVGRDKMWEIGLPRNDILFQSQPVIVAKVKAAFKLPDDTKIVLYAPTYRGASSSVSTRNDIDINSCLSALGSRFGGQWCFFYRAHYFFSDENTLTGTDNRILDATGYDDMQELLCASDVLITDYSSSMWDFSLTGKPCFIYATDLSQYGNERDFYTPVSEWPFPVSEDNEELSSKIIQFDADDYSENIKRHHKDLGICETGKASQIVSEYISDLCLGRQGGISK